MLTTRKIRALSKQEFSAAHALSMQARVYDKLLELQGQRMHESESEQTRALMEGLWTVVDEAALIGRVDGGRILSEVYNAGYKSGLRAQPVRASRPRPAAKKSTKSTKRPTHINLSADELRKLRSLLRAPRKR